MPITTSAKKALRSSLEKKAANDRVKKNLKEKIKLVEKAAHDKKDLASLLTDAYSAIDKAAKKGVLKKNTASRRKAKVARLAKAK